jgi:hypothetical protein
MEEEEGIHNTRLCTFPVRKDVENASEFNK